jgi:hypothetical protein
MREECNWSALFVEEVWKYVHKNVEVDRKKTLKSSNVEPN